MTERFRVLILGYGEMGHAMEYLLKQRQQLDIWEKYPQDNFQSVVLEDAAPRADIVLFCLPVNPHREVAEQIAPLPRAWTKLVKPLRKSLPGRLHRIRPMPCCMGR